jgi:predicted small secreted protein
MKSLTQWVAIMILGFAVTGCNTMRGIGQDVQRGGEKVEGAAKDTQNKM